jgi:hypothetical protein
MSSNNDCTGLLRCPTEFDLIVSHRLLELMAFVPSASWSSVLAWVHSIGLAFSGGDKCHETSVVALCQRREWETMTIG